MLKKKAVSPRSHPASEHIHTHVYFVHIYIYMYAKFRYICVPRFSPFSSGKNIKLCLRNL